MSKPKTCGNPDPYGINCCTRSFGHEGWHSNGSASWQNPTWTHEQESAEMLSPRDYTQDDEDREDTCPRCHGTGGEPYDDGITPCEHCDGEGYEYWKH